VAAHTYIVANPVPHVPPSRAYLDLILAGARARDLPRRHIDRIAAFQTVEDLGGGAPKGLSRPE